ncbi:MAG: nucleotidyltransferase family protein [Flavobacterium sp.]|uniref:nucleotidyltransferase family protein n=1 Tax=Flavobacterium sp. TaxID=239 RepID=UPI00121F84A4|nr:nucleotidyltransferase family protein [Flavobacterium sp.]RZJ64260.1 MAG: nucleotidyltransferase family protein [Flavobacterium sp.]
MKYELGIIILAAGSSSRLGRPKQLLEYKGKPLLQHAVNVALNVPGSRVIVVTGANHAAIERVVDLSKATVVHNEDWESGMASSIGSGLYKLLELAPEISECILTVCDQPFLDDGIFDKLLIEFLRTRKPIIASAYAGTLGAPTLFAKKYFPSLLSLTGFQGAKKMFEQYGHDVASVAFERGNIDIDTQEDYDQLKQLS